MGASGFQSPNEDYPYSDGVTFRFRPAYSTGFSPLTRITPTQIAFGTVLRCFVPETGPIPCWVFAANCYGRLRMTQYAAPRVWAGTLLLCTPAPPRCQAPAACAQGDCI